MSTMHETIARAAETAMRETWTDATEHSAAPPAIATAVLGVLATPTPAMLDAGERAKQDHVHRGGGIRTHCSEWDWDSESSQITWDRHVAAAVYAAMVAAAGDAS